MDLLLSSRYWPPVYISDCARLVALCADMHYPELATKMWGRNQGCFSDPFEKPVVRNRNGAVERFCVSWFEVGEQHFQLCHQKDFFRVQKPLKNIHPVIFELQCIFKIV